MKVGVVGGGAIGLATAWYMAEAGADVTVIERDVCGDWASKGNAGWVTPALSGPLPAPGVTRQALRWIGKPDSPLLIRPRLSWSFGRWCWAFWRSSGRERYLEGMRAVLALNEHTLDLYDGLSRSGIRFEMHDSGLLFVALDREHLGECVTMFTDLRQAGYQGLVTRFDHGEICEFEAAVGPGVAGGVYASAERHVRPETFTAGLVAGLAASGAAIRERTEVTSLRADGRGAWVIGTPQGEDRFERVLVAAGAWTARVLRLLEVRLGLEAAKGYSLTSRGEGIAPSRALYLVEAKVGCSPFDDGVRLAGTLELAGLDTSLDNRRVQGLERAAAEYLGSWRTTEPRTAWAGLRPMAPDGLPYIGAVPGRAGVFVASGHAMLGMTLAPATGNLLAPLILEGREQQQLAPFRLDR